MLGQTLALTKELATQSLGITNSLLAGATCGTRMLGNAITETIQDLDKPMSNRDKAMSLSIQLDKLQAQSKPKDLYILVKDVSFEVLEQAIKVLSEQHLPKDNKTRLVAIRGLQNDINLIRAFVEKYDVNAYLEISLKNQQDLLTCEQLLVLNHPLKEVLVNNRTHKTFTE